MSKIVFTEKGLSMREQLLLDIPKKEGLNRESSRSRAEMSRAEVANIMNTTPKSNGVGFGGSSNKVTLPKIKNYSSSRYIREKIKKANKVSKDLEKTTAKGSFQDFFTFLLGEGSQTKYSSMLNLSLSDTSLMNSDILDYDLLGKLLIEKFSKMLYDESKIERLINKHKFKMEQLEKLQENLKLRCKMKQEVERLENMKPPEQLDSINREHKDVIDIVYSHDNTKLKHQKKIFMTHQKKYAESWEKLRDYTIKNPKKYMMKQNLPEIGSTDLQTRHNGESRRKKETLVKKSESKGDFGPIDAESLAIVPGDE